MEEVELAVLAGADVDLDVIRAEFRCQFDGGDGVLRRRFLATPAESVKFLAAKIQPAEKLDPERIRRLLADLGSDILADREAASTALRGMDERAIPDLEATLQATKSAEIRDRVKAILEHHSPIGPEQLRQMRAVAILEMIGDRESRLLLSRWADGAEGAPLTREAIASRKRIDAAKEK